VPSNGNLVLHPGLLCFLFVEFRKIFLSRNVIQCWNRFPRETLEPLTLEAFRTQLDKVTAGLSVGVTPASCRVLGKMTLRVMYNIFRNCLTFSASQNTALSAVSLQCPYWYRPMIFSVKVFF